MEPGHLRPLGRGPPADRDARPARRADRHRHAGQRGLPDRPHALAGRPGRAMDLRGLVRARRTRLLPRGPARPARRVELADRPVRRGADGSGRRAGAGIAARGPAGATRRGRGRRRGRPPARRDRRAGGQRANRAAWQRAPLAAAERGWARERALAVMLEGYLSRAATGQPVHTWPA